MAIRSTAALLTELVYTFLPLSPSTYVWWKLGAWTAALAIYWDAHFYVAHRVCHQNKAAYQFFHKMHHLCKEPTCFGAYFVTYQSHVVLEQLVVMIMAAVGLPRNVLLFSLYWGTISTYVEHSGFELGHMNLPLLPLTFGQMQHILGSPASWILEGKSNM
jgi:sterol desaturase/sphingolipid hydroxylase (fatty acid hydroxylase superfamily)